MNINKWINNNTESLKGKLVAITGASGDLGKEVSICLARLGANLLLINRNVEKTNKLEKDLKSINSDIQVYKVFMDFESFQNVKENVDKILEYPIDIFIANAASYKIERRVSDIGYDNVFQINFISQYYLIRKLYEKIISKRNGKIVVVSSIAYNYSVLDESDIDFVNNPKCNHVYGNSKRFLTAASYSLFKDEDNVKLSIVHPGISYTNITSHYPKWLFVLIKYPMKIIFQKPKKAALTIIKGVFDECGYKEWIGPSIFNIWGYPKKNIIKNLSDEEIHKISEYSDDIYKKI